MSLRAFRSIIEDLDLRFGPVGLITRYALAAEQSLRRRRLKLRLSNLDELLAVNKLNRDSWLPLFPVFDPTFNRLDDGAFAMIAEDEDGNALATLAARQFDWRGTNLRNEAESFRLLYGDVSAQKLPLETCEVTALVAKGIEGRVVFSGAAWYHPRVRGTGLIEVLPALSRAVAHGLWNSACTMTLGSTNLVTKGVIQRAGYSNLEMAVSLRNSRVGDIDLAVLWSKTPELLADLEARLQMIDRIDDQALALATTRASRPESV